MLFLQNLGLSGCLGADDSRKICTYLLDMHDSLCRKQQAIKNIKSRLNRISSSTEEETPESHCRVRFNTQLREEVGQENEAIRLRNNVRELIEENTELKRIVLGVDDTHLSFKDCCIRIFGGDFKQVSTFAELEACLKRIKQGPSGANEQASSHQTQMMGEIIKLQKEVCHHLI